MQLPSLDALCRSEIRIAGYLPATCRQAFCRVLTECFRKCVAINDIEAWQSLFFLPFVLATEPHSPTRTKFDKVVLARLADFENGCFDFTSLHPPSNIPTSSPLRRHNQLGSVVRLAAAGSLSKAARLLVPDKVAPRTAPTLDKLREKHPVASAPPRYTPPSDVVAATPVTEAQVVAALHSFPKGSAGGPSGLSPQHLLDCLRGVLAPSFKVQLTRLINLLLHGSPPEAVRPYLFGATLIALEKDGGDIRPVAIGATLRRLAAKTLLQTHHTAIASFFRATGHQLGLAPDGRERIVHAIHRQRALPQAANQSVYLVDFRNAFNSIDRTALLHQVARHFPSFSNFAANCYARESSLFFGADAIRSSCGVQQGDPLGPFFFSLVLSQVSAGIASSFGASLRLHKWYLDDGTLVVDSSVPEDHVLSTVENLASPLGLALNRAKTEQHALSDDFRTLGVPFGTETFQKEYVARKLKKAEKILTVLPDLPDSHYAFTLLRYCVSFCRTVGFIRSLPASVINGPLSEFDNAVASCLVGILGRPLSSQEFRQVSLSIAHGGCGLRRSVIHADAALLGSIAQAARHEGQDPGSHPFWHDATSRFNGRVAVADQLPCVNPDPTISQKILSFRIDSLTLQDMLQAPSLQDRARLRAIGSHSASAWLTTIPTAVNGCHMSTATFRAAMSFRLGRVDLAAVCPHCAAPQDSCGYHATSQHGKSSLHHAIKQAFASFCSSAHLSPKVEPPFPGSSLRPADCFLPYMDLGHGFCFDFATTQPLQPKYLLQSSQNAQSAATSYAKSVKLGNKAYESLCAANGFTYVPLVVDTYGAWDPSCFQFFKSIANSHAVVHEYHPSFSLRLLLSLLSVTLQTHVAASLLSGRSIPQGVV